MNRAGLARIHFDEMRIFSPNQSQTTPDIKIYGPIGQLLAVLATHYALLVPSEVRFNLSIVPAKRSPKPFLDLFNGNQMQCH